MNKEMGFSIGGRNITNIRYADDKVLLAESEEELQRLLDVVVEESEKKGLTINCKNLEDLMLSCHQEERYPMYFESQEPSHQASFLLQLPGKHIISEDARCMCGRY